MPSSTYVALGSVTLSSSQTQVTFSNIPQIYTDLIVVHSGYASTLFGSNFQFNGDGKTNYSQVGMNGNGTSATSYVDNNNTKINAVGLFNTTGDMGANVTYIMNYSNSTTFKTVLGRMGSAGWGTRANVSTWRKTAAINSITISSFSADTYSAGATFSLYGVGANELKATGGDIIQTDGTYWYHAFKSSGTFTPLSTLSCDVLVVGGGGGGGAQVGGGGGAGGVFYATSQSISAAQTITIGAGGAGGTVSVSQGSNGTNSTFGSLTAALGGGGGGSLLSGTGVNGLSGGSGGGGGTSGTANGTGGSSTQTGTGGTGYGFAGGNGIHPSGGGGGGAGAVGVNSATGATGGAGGAGLNTWSTWLNTTGTGVEGIIAGGGGGGSNGAVLAPGGTGGGGAGGASNYARPAAGLPNTGGGGGGTRDLPDNGEAGARGGSGLVIVRYAV